MAGIREALRRLVRGWCAPNDWRREWTPYRLAAHDTLVFFMTVEKHIRDRTPHYYVAGECVWCRGEDYGYTRQLATVIDLTAIEREY